MCEARGARPPPIPPCQAATRRALQLPAAPARRPRGTRAVAAALPAGNCSAAPPPPHHVSWLLNFLVTTLPSSRPRRSAIFCDRSWCELPLKILMLGMAAAAAAGALPSSFSCSPLRLAPRPAAALGSTRLLPRDAARRAQATPDAATPPSCPFPPAARALYRLLALRRTRLGALSLARRPSGAGPIPALQWCERRGGRGLACLTERPNNGRRWGAARCARVLPKWAGRRAGGAG